MQLVSKAAGGGKKPAGKMHAQAGKRFSWYKKPPGAAANSSWYETIWAGGRIQLAKVQDGKLPQPLQHQAGKKASRAGNKNPGGNKSARAGKKSGL